MNPTLRHRIYQILEECDPSDRVATIVARTLAALIILNVVTLMLLTVDSVADVAGEMIMGFLVASVMVFAVEYLLRLWVCVEEPGKTRLQYIFSLYSIIDLVAIVPVLVQLFFGVFGFEAMLARLLRIFWLVRIFKVIRYSNAIVTIGKVISSKKGELIITGSAVAVLIMAAASVAFLFERAGQPDDFSSVPQAMYWVIITLTTVGYGDIVPHTTGGKMVASAVSLLGVVVIAVPAGILASGFADEVRAKREARQSSEPTVCPHCGESIQEGES